MIETRRAAAFDAVNDHADRRLTGAGVNWQDTDGSKAAIECCKDARQRLGLVDHCGAAARCRHPAHEARPGVEFFLGHLVRNGFEPAFGGRAAPVVVIGRIGEYRREGLGLDAVALQRFA